MIAFGRLALAALVCVLVVACGQQNIAGTAAANAPKPLGADYVPPRVTNPVSVQGFVDKPCNLLSAEEARGLGLFASEADLSKCEWRKQPNAQASLDTLELGIMADRGLGRIHQQCVTATSVQAKSMRCDTWLASTVAGHPAILTNKPEESKYGLCRMFVGLADDVALLAIDGKFNMDAEDADCGRATRAATMVIERLRSNG